MECASLSAPALRGVRTRAGTWRATGRRDRPARAAATLRWRAGARARRGFVGFPRRCACLRAACPALLSGARCCMRARCAASAAVALGICGFGRLAACGGGWRRCVRCACCAALRAPFDGCVACGRDVRGCDCASACDSGLPLAAAAPRGSPCVAPAGGLRLHRGLDRALVGDRVRHARLRAQAPGRRQRSHPRIDPASPAHCHGCIGHRRWRRPS